MDTIQLAVEFREFLRSLSEHHVEYLLVGGYAVVYHGYRRATGDMDIWMARNKANAENIVAALVAFGFADTAVTPELFVEPDSITRMGNEPLRTAIMTTVSGLDFTDAYAHRVVEVIDGVPVSVISAEHLKINKRASGRLKDLADLESLP